MINQEKIERRRQRCREHYARHLSSLKIAGGTRIKACQTCGKDFKVPYHQDPRYMKDCPDCQRLLEKRREIANEKRGHLINVYDGDIRSWNFRHFGILPICRKCPNPCKQYNAPGLSRLVCPMTLDYEEENRRLNV